MPPTAVVGFGVTGRSVAAFLAARGERYVLVDTRPAPDLDSRGEALVAQAEACFWRAAVWPSIGVRRAVLSPGLAMDSCLVRSAQANGVTLVSDIDVFFEHVEAPVIGITGTNGKSTVTSLVGTLLNAAGVRCAVGGNLGNAALDLLHEPAAIFALELSSFQLERSAEHAFSAAAVLNVTEDHLDLHGDMDAYVAAKRRIFGMRGAVSVIAPIL